MNKTKVEKPLRGKSTKSSEQALKLVRLACNAVPVNSLN